MDQTITETRAAGARPPMARLSPAPAPAAAPVYDRQRDGQVVLVFQGGGALGAYQAGVYQAMQEAGIAPDWVIGTSIGAINAAIIAGNPHERRLARLREFWTRVRHSPMTQLMGAAPVLGPQAMIAATIVGGLPGFFEPSPFAWFGPSVPLGAEMAGYYNIHPLRKTLEGLIDVERMNSGAPRLTVGAAHVQDGEMRYFDSRDESLDLRHVMASGALPPAFPAVRIDGHLYWDGGILSNTPVEAVFDDNPRRSALVFVVHMWAPNGPEPDTLRAVAARQKDLQYASRSMSHIVRQRQIHKLRHVIGELARMLPDDVRERNEAGELVSYGCLTQMHVVRLLAPPMAGEDHFKDIDFSAAGIRGRWDAGYLDTSRVLAAKPWTRPCDPLEGLLLHEAHAGRVMPDQPAPLT
jgi:NTE family protein